MTEPKRVPSLSDAVALSYGELDWRRLQEGIEIAHLLKDRDREFTMVLLRFAPGATAVRHVHPEGEQYLMLEGSLVDGDRTLGRGDFVNHPPGSVHAPSSTTGALILVTWFGKLSVS